MAAGSAAAKGALQLIKWGKQIIPATADEIARLGPNAARVKGLLRMVPDISPDAHRLSEQARQAYLKTPKGKFSGVDLDEYVNRFGDENRLQQMEQAMFEGDNWLPAVNDAVGAESISDIIIPRVPTDKFMDMVRPLATGRRFDMTVPNAPEGFTNIARNFGERGLVQSPKDIELARRVSMLSPDMQQVYFNLLGEGTDPAQLLQALKLMGQ
jgi:hypothetical protein